MRAQPGDDVLDAHGDVLLPGLVNGHTHAAMTLFRGFGGDLPLMEWLEQKIWPAEARLTDDDVYWGTRLACLEMIRTGTVRFWDMYWRPAAVARAVRDAGLHATIGPPLLDGMDPARQQGRVRRGGAASRRARRVLAVGAAGARAARHLHRERADARVGRRAVGVARTYPCTSISSRPRTRSRVASTAPASAPVRTSTDSGCSRRGSSSRTACGWRNRSSSSSPNAARPSSPIPVSNLKLAVGRVFPYAEGARARHPRRPRHRWRVVEQLARPARRPQGARARPEVRGQRPGRAAGGRGVGGGHRRARTAARRRSRASRWGRPPTSSSPDASAPELAPGHVLDNLVYAASGSVVSCHRGRVAAC